MKVAQPTSRSTRLRWPFGLSASGENHGRYGTFFNLSWWCCGLLVALLGASPVHGAPAGRANRIERQGVFSYTDDAGVTHLSNVPEDTNSATPYRLLVGDVTTNSGFGLEDIELAPALPSSNELRAWVEQAAHDHRIEPALLYAVMWTESHFNANAVSRKGARGIMQLMPVTAGDYGVKDPFDPRDSIFASASYLQRLLEDFGGDLRLALAAYNAGSAAVLRYHGSIPPFPETQAYVPRVLSLYRQWGGLDSPMAR